MNPSSGDQPSKQLAALLWALLVGVALVFCLLKISRGGSFETNIQQLMPDAFGDQQQVSASLTAQAEWRLLILLRSAVDEEAQAQVESRALELAQALDALPAVEPDRTSQQIDGEIASYLFPRRQQLLSGQQLARLEALSVDELVSQRLAELYSPAPSRALFSFQDDPLDLGSGWLDALLQPGSQLQAGKLPFLEQGEERWYVISAKLRVSPFDLDAQAQLSAAIGAFQQRYPDQAMRRSGMVFHAAEGARIARSEISVVGVGALLGVLLLVVGVFRAWSASLFISLVLFASTVVALAASWLVFARVHLITLAFGSTLLGLAADYCFHFLVKTRASGDADVTWQLLRKGLLFSVLSSAAAYLAQLFSPFPGLHQFAVFIAVGLVSAAISVVVWRQLSLRRGAPELPLAGYYSKAFQPNYQRLALSPWILPTLAILVLLAMWQIQGKGVNDDIRHLNTSGKALLDDEREVAQLMQRGDFQRYFLLSGDSREQLLLRAENFTKLARERFQLQLTTVASLLPSQRQQQQSYQLVANKLYGEQGVYAELCRRLSSDCSWLAALPDYQPLVDTSVVPAALQLLVPGFSLLEQGRAVVILPPGVNAEVVQQLRALPVEGLEYRDNIARIGEVMQSFRQAVSRLLLVFFALLTIVSLLWFGRRGQAVIYSVALAVLGSLFFGVAGPITLFHILALLLVVGITVDAAVFYLTPGLDKSTWLAATLACATSMLAFGLLALSEVPMLSQFGSVVFSGLLVAWLVTPVLSMRFSTHEVSRGQS